MKVTTFRLTRHLKKWRVPVVFERDWDSPRIDPYHGANDMQGIVLHHTAGTDSLAFCMRGSYPPYRNCHFLVGRDSRVHVLSGSGAYHAGKGGPWRITKALTILKDRANSRTYGIEIESLGTSPRINGKPGGMTVDQVISVAYLCAALLDVMRRGPRSFRAGRVILHRTWAPTRKVDTRQDLDWWRTVIRIAQKHRKNRTRGEQLIRAYVHAHIDGGS